MTSDALLRIGLYLGALIALGVPLGSYMASVYSGEARLAQGLLGPVERALYRLAGVRPEEDMPWKRYAAAVLLFNLAGALVVYGVMRLQGHLPLNPAGLPAVAPEVSFNTAVSFATNTNWQAYAGESTMSYLTQMLALDRAELRVGRDRDGGARRADPRLRAAQARDDRQLLGRPDAQHALRPAAALARPRARPRLAGRRADASRPYAVAHCSLRRRRRRQHGRRPGRSRSGRPPRRSRSSSSAPTAAASSTSTRPIPSRTRRRSPTSSRCSRSCSSPPRSASRSARW